MTTIIGFAGRAGAGKTTAAQTLAWSQGFIIGNFAYRMKKAVSEMFNIPMEILLGDNAVKSVVDPRYGLSPRSILQKFGTEACRGTFGKYIWTHIFWSEFGGKDLLAIDDVRFEEEAQSIICRGGKIIEIINPLLEDFADTHASEKGLNSRFISAYVVNNGTIEELGENVEEAMLT